MSANSSRCSRRLVGRLGAEVEHLSPAAQDEKLVDFVRFIWKPGIWFDKFCVVRFVKAVNRKRLRTVFHKIVAQLMRQGLCQRGDTRGVEVQLRAVAASQPSIVPAYGVSPTEYTCPPSGVERSRCISTSPIRIRRRASSVPMIRQRRLVIARRRTCRIVHFARKSA